MIHFERALGIIDTKSLSRWWLAGKITVGEVLRSSSLLSQLHCNTFIINTVIEFHSKKIQPNLFAFTREPKGCVLLEILFTHSDKSVQVLLRYKFFELFSLQATLEKI